MFLECLCSLVCVLFLCLSVLNSIFFSYFNFYVRVAILNVCFGILSLYIIVSSLEFLAFVLMHLLMDLIG